MSEPPSPPSPCIYPWTLCQRHTTHDKICISVQFRKKGRKTPPKKKHCHSWCCYGCNDQNKTWHTARSVSQWSSQRKFTSIAVVAAADHKTWDQIHPRFCFKLVCDWPGVSTYTSRWQSQTSKKKPCTTHLGKLDNPGSVAIQQAWQRIAHVSLVLFTECLLSRSTKSSLPVGWKPNVKTLDF